ncbi:MAG: Fe-S cluster assembly protein SufD [Planctomycetales bacterium]|nr:Fe-S cluster assembly protein SufD [Planctomycetales bacterium]
MTPSELQSQPQNFDNQGFSAFRDQLREPEWLRVARADAWQTFLSLDWPSRKSEEWMRSDLRAFKLDQFHMPRPTAVVDHEHGAGIPHWLDEGVELAGGIATVDGVCVASRLSDRWSQRGVLLGDLSEMASDAEAIVRKYLFGIVRPEQDRFSALHAATFSGGHFVYVPRGVCLDQPIHLSVGMTDGGTDTGHTLIVIESGAEATVLHESNSCSASAKGLHLGAVEIVVKPGGHLRYVNLQDWGRSVWHFAHQRATVDRDASLQWTIAALGSRFAQVSQKVSLVGPGADCQVNGVLFTQDQQQLTYNTLQHHEAPSCRSDFLYKAALQDKSRTVWRGMIEVDPLAQRTDGYQRNDNLLLSEHARSDSIPGLEIQADDVRCTHGSTSGKIDEELIFYAQSRGFTRKEAARMIVTGFFQQIFDRITIDSVRDALGQAIARQVREYQ